MLSAATGAEQVTILERQAEAGRKILVSGGTRWCTVQAVVQQHPQIFVLLKEAFAAAHNC